MLVSSARVAEKIKRQSGYNFLFNYFICPIDSFIYIFVSYCDIAKRLLLLLLLLLPVVEGHLDAKRQMLRCSVNRNTALQSTTTARKQNLRKSSLCC